MAEKIDSHPEDPRVFVATMEEDFISAVRSGIYEGGILKSKLSKGTLKKHWHKLDEIWNAVLRQYPGTKNFNDLPFDVQVSLNDACTCHIDNGSFHPEGWEGAVNGLYQGMKHPLRNLTLIYHEIHPEIKMPRVQAARNLSKPSHIHGYDHMTQIYTEDMSEEAGTMWYDRAGNPHYAAAGDLLWVGPWLQHANSNKHDSKKDGPRYGLIIGS